MSDDNQKYVMIQTYGETLAIPLEVFAAHSNEIYVVTSSKDHVTDKVVVDKAYHPAELRITTLGDIRMALAQAELSGKG